jgi:hypothetical protein
MLGVAPDGVGVTGALLVHAASRRNARIKKNDFFAINIFLIILIQAGNKKRRTMCAFGHLLEL